MLNLPSFIPKELFPFFNRAGLFHHSLRLVIFEVKEDDAVQSFFLPPKQLRETY